MDIVRRTRPVSALVIAILFLVFGGLGLLGVFCVYGYLACLAQIDLGQGPNAAKIEFQIAGRHLALYVPMMLLASVGGLCEVMAGIGLLRSKPWGRTLGFVAAGLIVVSAVVGNGYQLLTNGERQAALAQNAPPQAAAVAEMGQVISIGAMIFGVVLNAVFVAAILIVLLRPDVRDYYRAGGPPPDDDGILPDKRPQPRGAEPPDTSYRDGS